MGLEDLGKSFSFLLDSLIEWAMAVMHPFQAAAKIDTEARDPVQAFRDATGLWFIAFLITYLFHIPFYKHYGISWENVGFHIIIILYWLSNYVISLLVMYGGCKLFRIKISFIELYIYYTAIVAVFLPFVHILNLFVGNTDRYITAIKTLKATGINFIEIFYELVIKSQFHYPTLEWYQILFSLLVTLFLIGIHTCIVHALSFKAGISKYKLMDALAFGYCIVIFQQVIFNIFLVYIYYGFLQ